MKKLIDQDYFNSTRHVTLSDCAKFVWFAICFCSESTMAQNNCDNLPGVHPNCLSIKEIQTPIRPEPTVDSFCNTWGNCWDNATSQTFNDSTRDVNKLMVLSGIDNSGSSGINPDSFFLSFSIKVPFLQSNHISLNRLRIGFQRPVVLDEGTAVIQRDTAIVINIRDGQGEFLEGEGSGRYDISNFDLNPSSDGSNADISNSFGSNAYNDCFSAISSVKPKIWFNTTDTAGGKPPFIGIQLILPKEYLAPIDPSASQKTYKIWYEFEIIDSVANSANSGYARRYVWPGGPSEFDGTGAGNDSEDRRRYPASSQWGTLCLYTDQNNPGNCPLDGVDLPAANIYLADGAAAIRMNGVPPPVPGGKINNLLAAPLVLNGALQPGEFNKLHGKFKLAKFGSQATGVDAPWNDILGCIKTNAVGNPIPGGAPALTMPCAFNPADIQLPTAITTANRQLAQLYAGLRVDMSDDKELKYVHNNVVSNFPYVQASTIDIPAEISTQGLPPLPNKRTRDLYVEVVGHNLPKYAKRVPGTPGKGTTIGQDEKLTAFINAIIHSLEGDVTVKQSRQDHPTYDAGRACVPSGKDQLCADELVQGIQTGQITAPVLRKMLSAGVISKETVEAATPSYRVQVFHDLGRQEMGSDKVMRTVVEPQYSFGFGALHAGDLTGWRYGLTVDESSLPLGASFDKVGPNIYKVSNLPNGGSVRVHTHVEAVEPKPWSIGLLLGAAIPEGTFGNSAKTGPAATLTLERELQPPMISAAATFGLARMDGAGPGSPPDVSLRDVGVGLKVYLNQPADWRIYALPTLDTYHFNQSGNKSGGSLALGLQYELSPAWGLDLRYGTHWVSTNAPQSRFSTLQAGLRYSF